MVVNGLPLHLRASDVPLGYWTSVFTQYYYNSILDRLRHLDLDRWFVALVVIHEAGGKISQQELAEMLHQDKVAMVRAVDHLSERGYVERHACPGDRRKHQLHATAKARSAVQKIKKAYEEVNQLAMKGMTKKERSKFMDQLSGMIGGLSGSDKRPVRVRYSKRPQK